MFEMSVFDKNNTGKVEDRKGCPSER